MSSSLCTGHMRNACGVVAQCAQQLVRILAKSEGAPRNIDRLLLGASMDIIGTSPILLHATS